MYRLLLVAFAAVFVALGLGGGRVVAADVATGANGGPIRVELVAEPHSLLPILQTSADEGAIGNLVFDTLVEFDDRRRVQPVLAAVVPTRENGGISADGLTITMHLRHGVRWQDGARFSAADVVYTINAILDPKNNAANRSFYTNIVRVTAVGTDVVVFHLKTTQASFLATVGSIYPIVPAHLLAKSPNLATDPFNAHPIGTGPYRLVRWQRGTGLSFAANPTYFRGAPKNPGVEIVIMPDSNTLAIQVRQHNIDFAIVESSTYNALSDAAGIVRKTEPLNDINALAMNAAHPILHDVRVRRAIVLAIDRTRLASTVSFGTGTPAYADLPLFMYDGHPPDGWAASDPVAAGKLLDDAGWTLGADGVRAKNGEPLQLQFIAYDGSASVSSLSLQVAQMLRAVGIDVSYKSYSPSLYFLPAASGGPVLSGRYDLAILSIVGGDDTSNDELYTCQSRIPAGFNYANYCNPEMERLQAATLREYDPVRRNRIVAQIEALAVRDATYVFLYHTPYRVAFSPTLQRTPSSISNRWYDIRDWTR
jgi:peptide/nickel transport system substrate-binding protein